MSFKDFVSNYQRLEICFLGPDSLSEVEGRGWEGSLFEGGWKRRVNAGGCRNYPSVCLQVDLLVLDFCWTGSEVDVRCEFVCWSFLSTNLDLLNMYSLGAVRDAVVKQ